MSTQRSEIADFLSRVVVDDSHLMDVAVRASLTGVNLEPVSLEVAIEDPRNRNAIARALNALAREMEF